MNISVIGAGNIGGALVRGWSKRGKDMNITVSGVHIEKLNRIKDDCPNIDITTDDNVAAKDTDMIVIAVKPWQVETVIKDIKSNLKASQTLISLAAGITLEQIEAEMRCESMTFISAAEGVDASIINKVENLFTIVGDTFVCQEKLIAPGMLMASCGIAYVMRFLRVQTEAGVEMGFYPPDALKIAIQTMKGAAELLHETGEHPEQAIDRVTTPGGYTIKGLNEMDHAGFNSAVIRVFKTGL